MKTFGNIYLLLLVAFFSACNDPYEDSTYQVYDMNPISSYLETRSDEFSEWITVLKYADLFNAVNQASSYFTVLVPTNEAVRSFYLKKNVSSIQELGKDYARSLAEYHIVNDSINLNTFVQGGKLEAKTLSDDYLSVSFDESSETGGFNSIYVNKEAHVKELAIQVSNGYVYVLNDVMSPLVENLYERISENSDKYSIFIEALNQTSWKDSLSIIYDEIRQEDNTVIQQKRNYTLLAVSDDTYRSEGVTSVADLAVKTGAVGTDYKDETNELFRYVAYHVIGGSYSVFDFNNFSGGTTTKLWTTKADAVLEASLQSGNKLYFNYEGEIDGQSVKAMFVEDGSDVQAKNGILHEIDSWLPLWESEIPVLVEWDFADYEEVAAWVNGGYGDPDQKYQTVDEGEHQSDVSSLACYTIDAKSSATSTDGSNGGYYPVGYATPKTGSAWTNCKNKDHIYLNLGYNGSIIMKTPILIAGKYKVILKVTYATSMNFMRTMTSGSNGGKIRFTFDGDSETTTEIPIYGSITANTLGLYDTVIYDEIEFSKTGTHSMKMVIADPAATSNSKFRIQLDYMTFEPIIEDE
jgi:putative fasciclin domain protein